VFSIQTRDLHVTRVVSSVLRFAAETLPKNISTTQIKNLKEKGVLLPQRLLFKTPESQEYVFFNRFNWKYFRDITENCCHEI